MTLPIYVQGAWYAGALLFIFGLKGMGSPASARKGIVIAGYGMLLAIAATFLIPGLQNLALMALALVLGGAVAWISGKKVKMTDMPQMVAIYNGMSVMATFLPEIHATAPPRVMARSMRAKLCMPGVRKVTTVASTMPTPAHTMPLRADTGELMPLRPRMKRIAATK